MWDVEWGSEEIGWLDVVCWCELRGLPVHVVEATKEWGEGGFGEGSK